MVEDSPHSADITYRKREEIGIKQNKQKAIKIKQKNNGGNKQKTNTILELNPNVPLIALNANGLNVSIKRA